MLKIIGLVVAVAVGGVLVAAAFRPDTFQVQRSARIQAPAEKIFPLINNLRSFNSWNPFEKKDPKMKGSYIGAASGRGAAYTFQGDSSVGSGSIEIVDSTPASSVRMRLDMLKPFETHNTVDFTLQPKDGATEVTWVMHGPVPYFAKVIHLFFDMDKMVGGEFDKGLASLKALAENPAASQS
jgi:hypothetical protein